MLDPQSKLNVEFKPPKKMKKRRQLDALVSNGKIRRKSKSGHEHELLRSNSESSEIDEFNIASQKSYIRHRGNLASSCTTCMVVFGFFLVGACILTCIGLIWMHFQMKQNLDNIRDRITLVEGRNQDSLENSQSVHSQIQAINKSVQNFKVGKNGLDQIVKNLTNISTKIEALNAATESLKEGLKAAPELKQIPTKLKAVSQSVTSLGSDVETLKQQVQLLNDFKTSIESQKDHVDQDHESNSLPSTPAPPMRESGSLNPDFSDDLLKKYENVSKSLVQINTTVWNRLDFLQTQLSVHKEKFAQVDNITGNLQKQVESIKTDHVSLVSTPVPPVDRESLHTGTDETSHTTDEQIAAVVKNMLNTLGLLNTTNAGKEDSEALDSLLEKMDNITTIVTNLKDQFAKLKETASGGSNTDAPSSEELQKFQTDTLEKLEKYNKTVVRLVQDMSVVFTKLTQNKNKIVSLDRTVIGLQNYLGTLGYKYGLTVNQSTETPSTPHPETQTSTEGSKSSAVAQNEAVSSTPKTVTGTSASVPHIHITNITTYEALDKNFRRWDKSGEGLVDPADLPDFLGPNLPDLEELKKFDVNGDGRYSMEEFEAALGIKPPTEEPNNENDEENNNLP